MNNYFTKMALQSMHRVFNLMDRNSFSKTFGCFDKNYWHFKTKDFPSSSHQMGVEFLARLWNLSSEENPYYRHPQILEWIKAGLDYSYSLQHKEGSFDEWYPNERGWAGPSSYVIHSLINAYKIVEDRLDESLKTKSHECFFKTSQFLLKQKEGAVLTNHFALFLLSLYEVYQVHPSSQLKNQFESHLEKLNGFTSVEGWSLEYEGVDFGYNLATMSFLGRLHQIFPEPFLKKYAEKHFNFLSYFFYPDGSFGGSLGSRETRHLYPYALKYWGKMIPVAHKICTHLFDTGAFERMTPSDQDDHYLFYRLNDYLEADLVADSKDIERECFLPWDSEKNFEKYFKDSGIFIKKSEQFYFVCNLKKGGCLELYNLKEKRCLLKNSGWLAHLKNKRAITGFSLSQEHKIEIKEGSISVSGASTRFKQKYFNIMTFLLFRMVLLLIRHYKLAFYLKKGVREKLILEKKKSAYKFERTVRFTKKDLQVEDFIYCDKIIKIFYGAYFTLRYVPQSNYFDPSDLTTRTSVLYPREKKKIYIRQTFHFKSNKVDLCVE